MKKIFLTIMMAACLTQTMAKGLTDDLNYTFRIGYNIGGNAPVGMPETIRSLNSYNFEPNISLGLDLWKDIWGKWGLLAGVRLENKGMNIDAIKRLTGRVPLNDDSGRTKSSIEISVRGFLTDEQRGSLQADLLQNCAEGLDVSFQKDNIYRRSRRLICFDMDSTLIHAECIDQLAVRAGVGDEVKAITESAMRGEIDFNESLTRRVALLKGLDESVMEEVAKELPYNEGLERMMKILKRVGYKTAILSGGFTYFGHYLQQKFGFDYVYANELEVENGKLTGRCAGEIVDGRRKAELLRLLCQVEHINLEQAVAVGDGANDLPMLGLAGLGIAYHAKPKVKANAKQSISSIGLDGILYFLGLKDSQIEANI